MSTRFIGTPWWFNGFDPDTRGWDHTRMSHLSVADFYYAAQSLHLYGSVTSATFSCSFNGQEASIGDEPRNLLTGGAREVYASGVGGADDIVPDTISVTYRFAGPLHMFDQTSFGPEMSLSAVLVKGVGSGSQPAGEVNLVPSGGTRCGTARLMDGFTHGLNLPLYYHTALEPGSVALADVSASVSLTGTRWAFN